MIEAYLGREVESQVAVVHQAVLDKQRDLAGQAELDRVGQTAGLAEVCEVLEREGEGDGLCEVDLDRVFGLLHVAALPELDGPRANVTLARELDSFFCALNRNCMCQSTSYAKPHAVPTGLRQSTQVSADALELSGGHGDGRRIVGLWDAEMLLVDVHELDVVLADPVVGCVLEDQVDDVRRVLCLERQDIVALCSAQHLCERAEVDAKGDVAVASEGREGLGSQQHGDEGDVGVVHGLQGDAGVIAVEVAILDEILDCIDNLPSVRFALCNGFCGGPYLLQHIRLV
jgi:hypothetical protein